MKIQILLDKNSWAKRYENFIKKKIKKFSNKIEILSHHNNLKKNFDINIIFSYFKKIPKKKLNLSKINLVPHESDLPKGKGMSPLSWQILEGRSEAVFSLIEADDSIDGGLIYYKKKIKIPKDYLFEDIKKVQLNENLKLIIRFIKYYKKNNRKPKTKNQIGKSSYYKIRRPSDSKINIKKSISSQFNLLRIVDNKNYPAFFYFKGKKYILRINKL